MIKISLLLCVIMFPACSVKTNVEIVQEISPIEVESNANSDMSSKTVKIDPSIPTIKPSNFIGDLRRRKKEFPNITNKELVVYGNQMLKSKGLDYTFDWTPKELDQENFDETSPFKFEFMGKDGAPKALQFINDDFGHPCYSTINIPLSSITDEEMTIISGGKRFEVKRPKEFNLEEFVLVDSNLKNTIRKWKTPIDATPVGISEDGKKIYFSSWEFDQDPENGYKESVLSLAVEVSEEGALKLVDLNTIKSGKGINIGYDKEFTEIIYNKYKIEGKEFIIKFSAPCT
jgi:hypothetical protein